MSVINTNIKAIVAQDSMRQVNLKLATAMERLSTGLRINSAKDDAAGLAISERMTAQVRGFGMAIKNANDGLSLAQTADGAYGQVTDMLQRIRELAVQAATGSMGPLDRKSIQLEIEELKMEIENVATKTHFNNIKLLDGTAEELVLQVGANQHDIMKIGFDSVRTKDIGSGLQPALTSVGGKASTFDALAAGDLVINGVLVNASVGADDSLSPTTSEVQSLVFEAGTAAGTITVADVNVALTADDATSVTAIATAVAAALTAAASANSPFVNATALAGTGGVRITFKSSQGNVEAASYTSAGGVTMTATEIVSGGRGATLAASAISKVAAINRVSEQSGVIARVNETTVIGTSMTPVADGGQGIIRISGFDTAPVTVTSDAEVSRANVVTAINNISAQTGVRAVDSGARDQGVMLIADDGRNIEIILKQTSTTGSFNFATTGLAASGAAETYVGTYSLYSQTGQPIHIDHQIGRDITGTGLQIGTFEPKKAIMVSSERSGSGDGPASAARAPQSAGVPPSNSTVGVFSGNTLLINDIAIGAARATDDTASFSTTASAKAASAIAIAAAINRKTDLHGVVARAEPNVIRSERTDSFVAGTSGIVNLNGVQISVGTVSRNSVLESINAFSGETGVIAKAYGDGIELMAEDGRNIVIGTNNGITASNLGLASVTIGNSGAATVTAGAGVAFYASVSLTADKAFTLKRGDESPTLTGSNFHALGFREGTFGGKDTGVKIAELDVSTQENASIAISAVDAALEDVLAAQARSGAFQNRLDAAVNVLTESVENISASRSRIQDTDYALEATNLAKAQIVSQAATAMLAQANQSQQSVLQLLQG